MDDNLNYIFIMMLSKIPNSADWLKSLDQTQF